MTELTYEVPAIGEKHQASDPRVSTALTQIKVVLNGQLTATNFFKETLTAKKFRKPGAWSFIETAGEPAGFEPTALSANSSVILSVTIPARLGNNEVQVKVGETQIASAGPPSNTKAQITIGPFRVPAGEAWSIKSFENAFVFKLSYGFITEVV